MRFIAVSLVAFGVSLLLLTLFVESAGMAKVPAQATRGGRLDAPQLPRQQALDLPLEGLSFATGRASTASRTAAGYGQLGTYTLTSPLSEDPVQEMVIYGVSFDMVGKQPIVL